MLVRARAHQRGSVFEPALAMAVAPAAFGPFFLLATLLMATKFPRLATVTGAIERVTGASCPFQA